MHVDKQLRDFFIRCFFRAKMTALEERVVVNAASNLCYKRLSRLLKQPTGNFCGQSGINLHVHLTTKLDHEVTTVVADNVNELVLCREQ